MEIKKQTTLNERLLDHNFTYDALHQSRYAGAKILAENYAMAENAVVVLSNMSVDISFICYGRLGERLGIDSGCEEVESIWEKKILDRVHPDDVAEKIAWELQLNSFIDQQPAEERTNYYLQHYLRIMDANGNYATLRHRIYYLDYDDEGHVLLSLCLYNAVSENKGMTGIFNSLDDTRVKDWRVDTKAILSEREREIMSEITLGAASKQIADKLCISVNTVNNHRQNIIRKLHCRNTAEAISVARRLGLI